MPGIGLLNPALLGGLAVACLPIIIHWLARRRYRRIAWGAMQFLLEAERKTRRRTRLEQWLLLALRCLALALIAAVMLRPFFEPESLAGVFAQDPAVRNIIVLDDSASLAYRRAGRSDFDAVRAAGLGLLERLSQQRSPAQVALYRTSEPAQPAAEFAGLTEGSLTEARRRVEEWRPADTPSALFAVLEDVKSRYGLGAFRLYIVSDMQRTDWLDADGEALRAFADERPGTRVFLVRCATPQRPNFSLTRVAMERPHAVGGLPATLVADVHNASGRTLDSASVTVHLAGASGTPQSVPPIAPGETATVRLDVTPASPGMQAVEVRLDAEDGLPLDNVRRVVLDGRDALQVVLVNGAPAESGGVDEVHFLRAALAPPGPLSSGMRVDVITPADLATTDLSDVDVLALCNVEGLRAAERTAVLRHLQGGGGVVISMGAEFDVAQWADADDRGPWLVPQIEGAVTANPGEWFTMSAASERPVGAALGMANAGADPVQFRQFLKVAPIEGEVASGVCEIHATFSDPNASPAMLERQVGLGRCFLFTSTLDADWNDWPRSLDGSYVVAMLETFQQAARRRLHLVDQVVGRALELRLGLDDFEPRVTFRSPGDSRATPTLAAPQTSGAAPAHLLHFTGPIAEQVGLHQVEVLRRSVGPETWPICVNFDPVESDLASLTSAELQHSLSGVDYELIEPDALDTATAGAARVEFWRPLLTLAALALMVEQALAWWFGRSAAPSRVAQPWRGTRAA